MKSKIFKAVYGHLPPRINSTSSQPSTFQKAKNHDEAMNDSKQTSFRTGNVHATHSANKKNLGINEDRDREASFDENSPNNLQDQHRDKSDLTQSYKINNYSLARGPLSNSSGMSRKSLKMKFLMNNGSAIVPINISKMSEMMSQDAESQDKLSSIPVRVEGEQKIKSTLMSQRMFARCNSATGF